MADEFGNYIYYGNEYPIATATPRFMQKYENRYGHLSVEERTYEIQGIRLLYYCRIYFIQGVKSALDQGADPFFTQNGKGDYKTAMYYVTYNNNGHATERLQIIKLLLQHGYLYKLNNATNEDNAVLTLERLLYKAVNLSEYQNDDADNYHIDVTDIKLALAMITIETLNIPINNILSSTISERNKKICLQAYQKITLQKQINVSHNIDTLQSGLRNRINPFHAQGTIDTIMEYALGKPYLTKEQRGMLMEDNPRGGKKTRRNKPRNKSRKTRISTRK